VKGVAPENINYPAPATHLREVWVALRMSLRHVLEGLTLSDVSEGTWPSEIRMLISEPDAWVRREADQTAEARQEPGQP
jgi:DNA-binding IscR family transcriptional regulator